MRRKKEKRMHKRKCVREEEKKKETEKEEEESREKERGRWVKELPEEEIEKVKMKTSLLSKINSRTHSEAINLPEIVRRLLRPKKACSAGEDSSKPALLRSHRLQDPCSVSARRWRWHGKGYGCSWWRRRVLDPVQECWTAACSNPPFLKLFREPSNPGTSCPGVHMSSVSPWAWPEGLLPHSPCVPGDVAWQPHHVCFPICSLGCGIVRTLYWTVQAAIREYHQLGGLNTIDIYRSRI